MPEVICQYSLLQLSDICYYVSMRIFDILFVFSVGTFAGWVLELVYRTLVSQKKLVNPGFLSGPYLPLYGFGVTFLYMVSAPQMPLALRILLFFVITTTIELITGEFFLRVYSLRLWDYSDRKFNYKGLICPLFSFYWTVLSLLFYYFIYPSLVILTDKFFVSPVSYWGLGVYYGFFMEDVIISFNLASRIQSLVKEFAEKERLRLKVKLKELPLERKTVDFKVFKQQFRSHMKNSRSGSGMFRFFNPFMHTMNVDLKENIDKYFERLGKIKDKIRK